MSNIELRNVTSWGNGAGILLPREWIGKQVKVILLDRTEQIKKEVLSILDSFLPKIIGIYLVGSYSRNEQTKDSDIDILVISNNLNKEIISGKYHVSIVDIESIRKTLKTNPIMIYSRLIEAKAILNEELLNELKKMELKDSSFKSYIGETKRIININKELIKLDKNYTDSSIIYSLILRLRSMFIIKNKSYSNNNFKKWILESVNEKEFEQVYAIYRDVRDNKKIKLKIKTAVAEKLLKLLENEVKKHDKKA